MNDHKRYIVTYDIPVYVSVSAPDEETAQGLASEYWAEQKVYQHIEDGLEPTDWYVGDPYGDGAAGQTVSLDESEYVR